MARRLDVAAIAAKFKQRASVAGPAYNEGVQNPRRDWKAAAEAGEANYAIALQAAIAAQRRLKAIRKVDARAFVQACVTKGTLRYSQGVAMAEDKYKANMAPYIAALNEIELPERFPKGDPRNLERVRVIDEALHEVKIALEEA
jgi:hypothetical protein